MAARGRIAATTPITTDGTNACDGFGVVALPRREIRRRRTPMATLAAIDPTAIMLRTAIQGMPPLVRESARSHPSNANRDGALTAAFQPKSAPDRAVTTSSARTTDRFSYRNANRSAGTVAAKATSASTADGTA